MVEKGNKVTADIKAILASIKKQNQDLQNRLCREEGQQTSRFTFSDISSINHGLEVAQPYNNNHRQTLHKHKDLIRNNTTKHQPSIKNCFSVVKHPTYCDPTYKTHDVLKPLKSNKCQNHIKASEKDNVAHEITEKNLVKDKNINVKFGEISNIPKVQARNKQVPNNGNKLSLEANILNAAPVETKLTEDNTQDKISNLKYSQNASYCNSVNEKNILCLIDKLKNQKNNHTDGIIFTNRESISFDDFCNDISIDNNASQTIRNIQRENQESSIDIPKEVVNKENFFPKSCSAGVAEQRPKKYSHELYSLPITNYEIGDTEKKLKMSNLKFDDFGQIQVSKYQNHIKPCGKDNVGLKITEKPLMKEKNVNIKYREVSKFPKVKSKVSEVKNKQLPNNSLSPEACVLNTTPSMTKLTEDNTQGNISNLNYSQKKSPYCNSVEQNSLYKTDKLKNQQKNQRTDMCTNRESISFDDFCNDIIKNIDNNGLHTIKNIQSKNHEVQMDVPREVAKRENCFTKSNSARLAEVRPKNYRNESNSLSIPNCETEDKEKNNDFIQNILKEMKCNNHGAENIEGNSRGNCKNKEKNLERISYNLSSNLRKKENSGESIGNSSIKFPLNSLQNEMKSNNTKKKRLSQNHIFHKKNKRRKEECLYDENEDDETKIKNTCCFDINVDTAQATHAGFKTINELKVSNMDKIVVPDSYTKPIANKQCVSQVEEAESEDFLPYCSQLSSDFIKIIDPLSFNSKQITSDELVKADIAAEDEDLFKPSCCHCESDYGISEISKIDNNTRDSTEKKSFELETPMDTEQFFGNSANAVDCVISPEDKVDEVKYGQLEDFFEKLIKEQRQNAATKVSYTKRDPKRMCQVKKYKKGNMKIYKIKRLKKQRLKTKVQTLEEENLNINDVIKKITQNVANMEHSIAKSESASSISTSSSYVTDLTQSDVLSTGSHELSSPQQRLRKGINELLKDKSLVCPQKGWEVATNDDKDELKMKIQSVFLTVGENFMKNQPTTLKYRRHSFDNCIFKDGRLQLKPIKESSMTVINSSHSRSQIRFKLLLYIMKKIQTLLETNKKLTKRELYYQLKTLVNDQRAIDRIVNSISSLLDVGTWALNIIAQKGLVFGNLKILLTSGEFLNCNIRGTLIPQDVSDIVEIHSCAYFILVVEKESIFYKLIDEGLPEKLTRPFIMITGKGFPDLNTQLFLNKLWMVMSIPVFILVDGDPHGINIMLNYRFGSVNNAHVSQYLAVPNAKWLGIYPSEILNLNLTREPLSERELRLVDLIMKTPYVESNPRIVNELKVLQEKKYKAEIEGLIKTDTFLTDVYLSNKFFTHNFI